MSGKEFAHRITAAEETSDGERSSSGAGGSSAFRPLFYGRGERYYMQADLPEAVVPPGDVPLLWRSLGLSQRKRDGQAQPMRLWVSTHGATTPLHFDAADSFLAQARGSKRIVFFPPSALPALYPFPRDHPLFRRSRVDLYERPESRGERFPRFDEAAEAAEVVNLDEGDVVLFPRYWWHHIETTSDLSCSIGCRYVR
jgi:hypothetical protein